MYMVEAQFMWALVLKHNLLLDHHQAASEGWDVLAVAFGRLLLQLLRATPLVL
jgi:hypothetical protein